MSKLNAMIHKKDHTERVIGRKAKGPQAAGGNKLQVADSFILFLHKIGIFFPIQKVIFIVSFLINKRIQQNISIYIPKRYF